MTYQDAKLRALRERGTVNSSPERVNDPLFQDGEFFDPRDVVQVKYEMLRTVAQGAPVTRAAADHGFSRPSFYKSQEDFQREGLAGLIPRKRGPKRARTHTSEVMEFVLTSKRR